MVLVFGFIGVPAIGDSSRDRIARSRGLFGLLGPWPSEMAARAYRPIWRALWVVLLDQIILSFHY